MPRCRTAAPVTHPACTVSVLRRNQARPNCVKKSPRWARLRSEDNPLFVEQVCSIAPGSL
jgi:hypothetical protein